MPAQKLNFTMSYYLVQILFIMWKLVQSKNKLIPSIRAFEKAIFRSSVHEFPSFFLLLLYTSISSLEFMEVGFLKRWMDQTPALLPLLLFLKPIFFFSGKFINIWGCLKHTQIVIYFTKIIMDSRSWSKFILFKDLHSYLWQKLCGGGFSFKAYFPFWFWKTSGNTQNNPSSYVPLTMFPVHTLQNLAD